MNNIVKSEHNASLSFLTFSENVNHSRLSARQVRHMIEKFDDIKIESRNTRCYNGDLDSDAEDFVKFKSISDVQRRRNRRAKKKASKARAKKEFEARKPKKCSIKADTEFDEIMRDSKPQNFVEMLNATHTVQIKIAERMMCHAAIFATTTSKVALSAQLIMLFNDLTGITLTDVVIQSQVIPHLLSFMGHQRSKEALYEQSATQRYSDAMSERFVRENPNWEEENSDIFEDDREGYPQSSEDPILKLGGFLADSLQTVCGSEDIKLSDSILFNKFANICQYICMAPILLTLGLISKVEDWTNFRQFIVTGLSNVKGIAAIIDFVTECKRGIVEYFSLPVEARSLAVFLRADKMTDWSSKVLEFCNFAHDKDWMCGIFDKQDGKASRHSIVTEAVKWAKEQYAIGKRLALNAKFESRWSGVYASLLTRLSTIMTELSGELAAGRIKPMPFSILIHGEPGVMKSRFTHATLDVLAHVYGIENVPGNIYVRNPGTKHHDGAQGGQRMWLFDDLAQEIASLAEGSLVNDLIGGINTISPLLNMAALEHKSVTTNDAEVVVGSTNVKDLQAAAYFKAPAAALRRFPYVVSLSVKPELLQKGGVMMRSDIKIDDDDLERWLITVEEVIVVNKITVKYEPIMVNATSVMYFQWLLDTATRWRAKQQSLHDEFMNRDKSVCKHGYPGRRCPSCKKERVAIRVMNNNVLEFKNSEIFKFRCFSELPESDLESMAEVNFRFAVCMFQLRHNAEAKVEEIVMAVPQNNEPVEGHTRESRWFEWVDKYATPVTVKIMRPFYGGFNFLWLNLKLFFKIKSFITWDMYKTVVFSSDDSAAGFVRRSLIGDKPTIDEVKLFSAASIATKVLLALGVLYALWKVRNMFNQRAKESLSDTFIKFDKSEINLDPGVELDADKDYFYRESDGKLISVFKSTGVNPVPQGYKMATKEEIEAVMRFSAKLGLPASTIPVIRVNTARKWDIVVPKRELGQISHWANPTWQEKLKKALLTNLVAIRAISREGTVSSYKGVFITGSALLVPSHCVQGAGEMEISWAPGTTNARCIKVQFSPTIVIHHPTKDVALVNVICGVAAKTIRKYFIKQQPELINDLFLEVVEVDNNENMSRTGGKSLPVTLTYTAHKSFKERAYEYTGAGASRVGKCGALALGKVGDSNFLVGIHVSGDDAHQRGFILPIYLEDIELMASHFPATPALPDDDDLIINGVKVPALNPLPQGHCMSKFLEPSGLAILGHINGQEGGIRKSEVVETPLRSMYDPGNVFGPPKFGGFMHEGSWVSNTENKVKNLANHDYSMDPDLEDCVANFMIRRYKTLFDFSKASPLSLTEVIGGIPGSVINKMVDKTSSGVLHPNPKSHYFRQLNMLDPTIACLSEEMLEKLDLILDRYERGLSAMFLYGWADKDEPIKRTKTLSGGTRVFNPSPLPLLILMKMFFEPIAAILLADPHKCCHKIGINAVSEDWDKLVRFLVDPKEGFLDGTLEPTDQKGYDSRTEMYKTLLNFIDLVREYGNYTKEQLKIMEMLAYDASHAGVCIQGAIVMTCVGSWSGAWQTALTNSWALEKLEFQAYVIAARWHLKYAGDWRKLLEIIPDFYEVIRLILYGDDTIINKHQRILSWYTIDARVKAFALLGFEVTSDVKGELPSAKRLVECTFLKRGFRYDLERRKWACPLELASIYKSLSWEMGHPTLSHGEYMGQLIDNAEREFFQHGREVYASEIVRLEQNHAKIPEEWQTSRPFRTYEQMLLVSDGFLFTKDM